MPNEKPTQSFTPYEPKKGEEYMSDEQRAHFADLLRAWQQELQDEIDRTVHRMQ
ncbi:MAG: RNA polymerase-binding protein DksA, partial [Gammaproteobacteria bacterium]|nr:RNA polymerase-binding protein DksA [Gammaproteobacteria bacterium]